MVKRVDSSLQLTTQCIEIRKRVLELFGFGIVLLTTRVSDSD